MMFFSKHIKSYSSKDNYTNKPSSEMHTGIFFTSHFTPTLPFPYFQPPESLGLLTLGATISQNGLHSLSAGAGHAVI